MGPFATWAAHRRNTIKELQNLAKNMKFHAGNAKKASAVGTGTSIVTGAGAAVCFFAAPFTFGGSLIPATALGGVSIAGAATSVGSSVVNFIIEKCHMSDVQSTLDADRESLERLLKYVKEAKAITVAEGAEYATKIGKAAPGGIKLGANLSLKIAQRLAVSEKVVTILVRLGKVARFAGHAATLLALPLDIIFFVKDILDLKNNDVSAAADKVLELAKQLQYEYENIMSEI
ncbi:uncharacterized protein LOC123545697 [Mercenaria mercenaria]|uniref:uncharacterized protein LOC123545697 n=1 Tax=Mercenaria mercenaria TaxID=6596 RepID=UPI00234F1F4C|nr:uncharacterized protein LOC123545697 [Mercenaria mercenaria]